MKRYFNILLFILSPLYITAVVRNEIIDSKGNLNTFFSLLDSLAAGKDTVINVVHLGDSHIQAGFFSGKIRQNLHSEFGNAGRGWLSPLKLANSNEGVDYFFNSNINDWLSGKIINNIKRTDIGPGAMGIASFSDSINFEIGVTPLNGAGYEFSRLILYRDTLSYYNNDYNNEKLYRFNSVYLPDIRLTTDTFILNSQIDTLKTGFYLKRNNTDYSCFFGVNLINDNKGILYHSIGINGAKYDDFTDENYLKHLSVFNPCLLIISLGTNESFAENIKVSTFAEQLDSFYYLIKKNLPNTAVILTTPAECFIKSRVNGKRIFIPNPKIYDIAKMIRQKAIDHGFACWDLFEIYGGKGSSKKWFSDKMMSNDRIHFNRDGYIYQGDMFYEALIRKYKENYSNNNN